MPERILTNIDGRQITLTHLDRVVYPQIGIVKAEIINYYLQIAAYILPHLLDRPLVFTRYPEGVAKTGFFQKNAPSYLPVWIDTLPINLNKKYIMVREKAALGWLANHGCIEIHPWLSRVKSLTNPDFLVLDLDPSPENTYRQVASAARELHRLLNDLKLVSYPKTSGGRGLHIYIPIKAVHSYQSVREAALAIAGILINKMPQITTIERVKAKRGNRIYVDCLQIGEGKTLCAPYSLRPSVFATVSTPLQWDEVPEFDPTRFTLGNIVDRLEKYGDLFSPVLHDKQALDPVIKAMSLTAAPMSGGNHQANVT
ncbi:MAG: non-homologous end-joining DNA ligase [Methylocystaceae bacterium]